MQWKGAQGTAQEPIHKTCNYNSVSHNDKPSHITKMVGLPTPLGCVRVAGLTYHHSNLAPQNCKAKQQGQMLLQDSSLRLPLVSHTNPHFVYVHILHRYQMPLLSVL